MPTKPVVRWLVILNTAAIALNQDKKVLLTAYLVVASAGCLFLDFLLSSLSPDAPIPARRVAVVGFLGKGKDDVALYVV